MSSWSWSVFLLLWPAPCLQAGSPQQIIFIEQEFSLQSSEGQETSGVHRLWFDDKQLRGEVTAGDRNSIALVDLDAELVTLVFPRDHSWLKLSLNDYLRVVASRLGAPNLGKAAGGATLETVAESEVVGHWQCRRLAFRLSGPFEIESEIWVTDQAGIETQQYLAMMKRLGLERFFSPIAEQVQALGGLPVQSVTRQKIHGVTLVSRHLVKTVEKKARPAGLFEVPAGYHQLVGDVPPEMKMGGTK